MSGRRFLLMHVTTSSGHHHASRAVAQALRRLDPLCQIISVDAFDYTSRFVRWAIQRSYMRLIRHHPDVWEYLYDNPAVHQHLQHIRRLLHRYHLRKVQRLLQTVQPHAVACTQAFPCGMIADFKQHHGEPAPLVGILTDFAPHLYWLHETVDHYILPSSEMEERFLSYRIPPERLHAFGIPVEPRFQDPVDRAAAFARFGLDASVPVVLVMGGGSGLGPLRELMQSLDRIAEPCQCVVLTGTNRALLAWFGRQSFRHRVVARGYEDGVPQLMDIAAMIITKPGGLTTAESMAKCLPMLIISPIPGQEMCNARVLLAEGAAMQLGAPETVGEVVAQLLREPERLARLRANAARLARPDSATRAAELLIELADRSLAGQPVEPALRAA
jgi:processive 1,2-diacylglycerol beta-glucosyltransferase